MDRTERFYRIDQLLKSGVRSFAELKKSLGISTAQLKRDVEIRIRSRPARGSRAAVRVLIAQG